MEALEKEYGSYESFQQKFKDVLMGLQGSGFVVSSRKVNRWMRTDGSVCV